MADLITNIRINSSQFDSQIKKSKKQVKGFEAQISTVAKTTKSSMAALTKFAAPLAAFAGVSASLNSIIKTSIAFEKSLSNLQSLLGVTTDELKLFEVEAVRLGSTTTQTASQVVEAFQLIGSQQPELLKNRAALVEVTEQAIILAEAAGLDVPTAAKALSGALNQMGDSADNAGKYINILAAASQQGSADIPYLNQAIEKAGGTASSVGIKFNELVASIEAIAPKFSSAQEAGTGLRNVFLIMESSIDKNLNPSVVGFTQALTNLAAKQLSVTQLTEMFGRGNVTAANALISAKAEYINFADSIVGTNTALEQQKINNDNVAGSVLGLQSAWEGFTLTVNKSNGQLKNTIDFMTKIIQQMTNVSKSDNIKFLEASTKAMKLQTVGIEDNIKMYQQLGQSQEEAVQSTKKVTNELLKAAKERLGTLESQRALGGKWDSKESNNAIFEVKVQIESLEQGLNYLNDWNNEVKSVKTSLESVNAELDKASKKKLYSDGSIGKIDEELKTLRDKLTAATNSSTRAGIRKAITDLQAQKNWIELEATLKVTSLDVPTFNVDNELKKSQQKPKTNPKIDADISSGKIDINQDFSGITQQLSTYNNEQIKAIELQKAWANGIATTASGFQNLSVALSQVSGENQAAAQTAKILMVISQGLAAATAIVEATKTGFPAMLFAIPAALAAVVSAFSTVGSFENGGIVGGNSFTGDKLTARVNSGEMILNNKQQANLFNLLNNGGNGSNNQSSQVTFRIKGEQLYGVLKNYNSKKSKF